MQTNRRVLSIGLGVLVSVLVTGCAVAASTGGAADSSHATPGGAASGGSVGSSFGEGRDPVTQPGPNVGMGPVDGDDGTGGTSRAGVGGAGTADGGDAPVSSADAVGGSASTRAHGVDGKVVDQEGNPVPGALVTPTSLDMPARAVPEVAVFTNDQGRYSWVLPVGRYRITVTANGQEVSGETEVPESGTATLDLQLSSG